MNKTTTQKIKRYQELINFSFDLTPVDLCAKAVVKLVLFEKYNNVYHVLNNYEFEFTTINTEKK